MKTDDSSSIMTIHNGQSAHNYMHDTDSPFDDKEEAAIEIGGLVRPPMNQAEFDQKFEYHKPEDESEFRRQLKKFAKSYYQPFTSCYRFKLFVTSLIPIIDWLPKYSWKQDFLADFIGGITVGIMHVPQGIAYALLAKQDAVIGLYTSFFAPLFYMIFGTSRHSSIGSFAVVSLMAGLTVTKFLNGDHTELMDFPSIESKASGNLTREEIASTLTLTIGIIQLLMGFLRLSFMTSYFSDQLVAGFTTGASVHVFTSQIKDLLGLRGLPARNGAGNVIMKLYDYCIRYNDVNLITLAISAVSILFLIIGKECINPLIKRIAKVSFPIPFELLLVVGSTVISHFMGFRPNYNVKIVKTIPTGFPIPTLPNFSLIPYMLTDAIGISIVVVAIHISLSKMFAKKLNYTVDAGQELFALGLTSSACGFLPVYPVACSLGRTLVNVSTGTKTQLSSVFSSLLLMSCIVYFGKYLEDLPMCVLSAIVIVALKGMVEKFSELKTLWPLSKIDFSIWVVSFVSTVCIDVMPGLAISIFYALFTTIMREQWPRWHLLGNVSGTTDYRDSERYGDVYFFHGICIFRFDSPLLFTNVERFKKSVAKAYRAWEKSHEFYILRKERSQFLLDAALLEERPISAMSQTINSSQMTATSESKPGDVKLLSRHFIVDCSGFTFVDYMGVSTLKEVYAEMRNRGVLVYFAACKAPVRDLFESSGFYSFVAKENFYPTIRDAVAIARRTQLATGLTGDAFYTPEHDRLSELISSLPMN